MQRLTPALISALIAVFWANSASAATCGFLGPCAAPEIDGTGGLTAIVLLASLGAVAYRKIQPR